MNMLKNAGNRHGEDENARNETWKGRGQARELSTASGEGLILLARDVEKSLKRGCKSTQYEHLCNRVFHDLVDRNRRDGFQMDLLIMFVSSVTSWKTSLFVFIRESIFLQE